MNNRTSPAIRHLALSGVLAGLAACATTAGLSDTDETADSESAPASMVLTGAAAAGTTATGEAVHCRRMPKPGSRVTHTVCMTDAERRAAQEHAEDIRRGSGRRTLKSRTAR